MRISCRPVMVSVVVALVIAPAGAVGRGREMSFEDRVRAQMALERAAYSHQIGTTRSFEEAVPLPVLQDRVRLYLRESAALDAIWNTPVTSEMLSAESGRMARQTRMPERLLELYGAAGNDAFVFQETAARAALVDRLARDFYAYDASIHAPERREAETLRSALLDRTVDRLASHPRRAVREVEARDGAARQDELAPSAGTATPGASPLTLSPDKFRKWRASLPRRGEIGPLVEDRSSFAFSIVLSESADRMRVATYTVPKKPFEEWFGSIRTRLDPDDVKPVASATAPLPRPSADSTEAWKFNPGALSSSDVGPLLNPSCVEDTWDSGGLAALPDGRAGTTAIWTGSRMLVWGGSTFGDYEHFDTGGRYDPATDTWTATAAVNAPSPRKGHSAVWTGSVMIVWGGNINGIRLETGGRYDPVADSWSATSMTNAPSARDSHTAIWTGSKMIVWGGLNDSNTGGVYDPVSDSWSPTSTLNAPQARLLHSAVWTGNRMIVWGGGFYIPTTGYLDSGRSYDPDRDSWSPISFNGVPTARWRHSAVWSGSEMIVWGGEGSASASVGGRYDPRRDRWSTMSSVNEPPGLIGTAVWSGSDLLVWGGDNANTSNPGMGGRYDPQLDHWTAISTVNAPSARYGHAAVWTGSLMIVWGGLGANAHVLNSGGRYDPLTDSWTPTSRGSSPAGRTGQSASWTGSKMVVWGGETQPGANEVIVVLNSGGVYDPALDSWTPTSLTGAPSARVGHTAVWTGERVLVWGGLDGASTFFNSGGSYDPLTDTWSTLSLIDVPRPRWLHVAVWTGRHMIVWGGVTTAGTEPSGGTYDPKTDTWLPVATTNGPIAVASTAVWTGRVMIVWGGRGQTRDIPGVGGVYDPVADSWTPTSRTGAPTGREGHTAVWTGRWMIIWGGYANPSILNTGGRYDPSTDQWSPVTLLDAPTPRSGHSAIWSGERMIVWGGAGGSFLDSGGRYDPEADRWDSMSTVGAPAPRTGHSALWTSSQMLIWGGSDTFTGLESGGRYCACSGTTSTFYQDADGDGFGDSSVSLSACVAPAGYVASPADCSDGDPTSWSPPSEVGGLLLSDNLNLTWSQPALPGGTGDLYDVVRSVDPTGFGTNGLCVASNTSATAATDAGQPDVGRGFFYLVRAENGCPDGSSILGYRSDGTAIAGPACP